MRRQMGCSLSRKRARLRPPLQPRLSHGLHSQVSFATVGRVLCCTDTSVYNLHQGVHRANALTNPIHLCTPLPNPLLSHCRSPPLPCSPIHMLCMSLWSVSFFETATTRRNAHKHEPGHRHNYGLKLQSLGCLKTLVLPAATTGNVVWRANPWASPHAGR